MVRGRRQRGSLAACLCIAALGVVVAPAAIAKPTAGTSIIGGQPAAADWAFTAAVLQDGRFICSGSVVSATSVVTAAHCVRAGASRLAVVTGRFALRRGGGQVTGVTSAVAHPGFATSRAYDVAVLRLSTPTVAPPIPLASPTDDASYVFNGQSLSVAGFGSRNPLTFGKPKLGTLMATGITVLNLCRLDPRFVPQAQICARGRPINRYLARGSCVGDSGGPMAGLTDAGPRLFGISSSVYRSNRGLQRFIRCGNRKLASVYSRVAESYSFILANL